MIAQYRWSLHSVLLLAALAGARATQAATPLGTAVTYQGQLKQSGSPVNGTVNLDFTLWSDPAATDPGSQIGAVQTIPGVSVTGGLFTVTLNDGGEFGATAFNGQKRWLAIGVNGTPLSPRQELTATPYATFALAPWASSAGNVSYSTGSVGIGTTSPLAPLHITEGSAGVAPHANAVLAVERSANNYLNLLAPNANETGVLFGNPTNLATAGGIIFNAANTLNGLQFRTDTNDTHMVITSAGNVGIGNTSPLSPLQVGGAYTPTVAGSIARFNGDVSTNGTLVSDQGTLLSRSAAGLGAASIVLDAEADAGGASWFINSNADTSPFDSPGGALTFSNGTDQMTITSAGNVGIGTGVPAQRLHVAGGLRVDGAVTIQSVTRRMAFSALDFQDVSGVRALNDYDSIKSTVALHDAIWALAPVHLPDGAVVTKATFSVHDFSPDVNWLCRLVRHTVLTPTNSAVTMASVLTSGTPGDTVVVDTTIAFSVVDNGTFSYYLVVSSSNNLNIPGHVFGAIVEYTVTQPLP